MTSKSSLRAAAKASAIAAVGKVWRDNGPIELPESDNLSIAELWSVMGFQNFSATAMQPLETSPELVLPILQPLLKHYNQRSHNRTIREVMEAGLKLAYPELWERVREIRDRVSDAERLEEIFLYVDAAERN